SDASGAPAGGVVMIRDVTTQRDVSRLRDDLLSIASHDLRTPATVLKIQAQMMQRELNRATPSPANLSDRVQTVLDQTERLTTMLDLLLDLTRVEAGRFDLRVEPTDLVRLIRRVAASVQTLSTRHVIHLDVPARLDGVWDAGRL